MGCGRSKAVSPLFNRKSHSSDGTEKKAQLKLDEISNADKKHKTDKSTAVKEKEKSPVHQHYSVDEKSAEQTIGKVGPDGDKPSETEESKNEDSSEVKSNSLLLGLKKTELPHFTPQEAVPLRDGPPRPPHVSASQVEFFRMLDEKINQGSIDDEDDISEES